MYKIQLETVYIKYKKWNKTLLNVIIDWAQLKRELGGSSEEVTLELFLWGPRYEDTAWRRQARKRAFTRKWICGYPNLGLPASGTMRNKFLLSKPPSVRYFVTAACTDRDIYHYFPMFSPDGHGVCGTVKETKTQEFKRPRCETLFWSSRWPWASHLASLCLSHHQKDRGNNT